MGNGEICEMKTCKLAFTSLIVSILLTCNGACVTRALSLNPFRNTMPVELVDCYDSWLCTFNIKGNDSILGRNVLVEILGYNAPSVELGCYQGSYRAKKARSFLILTLRDGTNIELINPQKRGSNTTISAHVTVDGVDLGSLLITEDVAAPENMEIDWCEGPPKEFEI